MHAWKGIREKNMHLIICHSDGGRKEALLLAAGPGCLRLAMEGCPDAIEFRFIYGHWIAENGEPVEVESIVGDDAFGSVLAGLVHPHAISA